MGQDSLSRINNRSALRPAGRNAAVLSLALALVVGIQLGALPWRYRKQLWQLQGGAVGLVVGYMIGRLSRGGRSEDGP